MKLRHWTIPLLYAAGATVWIFATDGVVDALSKDKNTLQSLQLIKGLLFVGLSAALLALLVHRERQAREALEQNVTEQRLLVELVQRCEDLARSADTTRALAQGVCDTLTSAPGVNSALVRIGHGADRVYLGVAGATEAQFREDLGTIVDAPESARRYSALVERGESFHATTASLGIRLPGVEALMMVGLGRPPSGVLAVRASAAKHFTPGWQAAVHRIGLAIEAGLSRLDVRATLDTFLETVPISVTVFDGEGRLRLINAEARAGARVLTPALELEERVPESYESFGAIAAAHAKVRQTKLPVVATHRVNGRTYDTTHVPLPDSAGRVNSVAMLARDITDEVALRQALRALTTESMRLREEEQARLSRDLHDDLGQRLTALKLQLRAIERVVSDLPSMPGDLVDRVVEASALADDTVHVQRISQALRPAALEALGLPAALRDEVSAFSRRSGIACTTDIEELTVDPLVATHAFRIAQEALTNVARHARAKQVHVGLTKRDGVLVLRVEDDGVGFEPLHRLSLGLLSMDERARQVGGRLDLERRERGGTVVRLTVGAPP
ncbi:MAG: PAS domain-containing protein [Archangiaceae bacterium]|nr:PAS domain-containing protein [Archangiaceae bacterium]